jgi:hypothetical protein
MRGGWGSEKILAFVVVLLDIREIIAKFAARLEY